MVAGTAFLACAQPAFEDDFSKPKVSAKNWKNEDGNTLRCEDGEGIIHHRGEWGTVPMREFVTVDLSKKVYLEYEPVSASGQWVVKTIDDQDRIYSSDRQEGDCIIFYGCGARLRTKRRIE